MAGGQAASPAATAEAIGRARAHSPFLARLIERRPDLIDAMATGDFGTALALARAVRGDTRDDTPGDTGVILRQQRQGVALVTAIADLSGAWDLARVTAALSDFADHAVDTALTAAIEERFPGAGTGGFAVIALGKQGGRELNYSSDIDPILLFDPDSLPRRPREDVADSAVRIGRRMIELLSARTSEGYVFRVDLRLRPSPEVTPIVLPVGAALSYYESQALAWEQAAFIRARACAGDRLLGQRFLAAIDPFIWRRSLDFGQIRRIADISQRIRGHYADGQAYGPGYDLKRGHGGIREIEFFAQVQQLIHGGRDAGLRQAATCDALAALARAGHIPDAAAGAMAEHYRRLRTIEHRLQMVDDQQTHRLPTNQAILDNVAALHGLCDGAALLALLEPVVADVGLRFDAMMGMFDTPRSARWASDEAVLASQIAAAGIADTGDALRRIAVWRSGQLRVLRSQAARDALEDVLPPLMAAIGEAADPTTVLARFDALISGLPSAINLFNLLAARPQLLATLVAVLGHAPALAADLAARPELIEGLIDASVFSETAQPETLARRMAGRGGDYEAQLDHVRRVVGDHRFALGVQLVEGTVDPLTVARGYADIADAAIDQLTAATVAEFERAHGRIDGGELVILALGRLGGRALTHASDLDLILLFTGDILTESDGGRRLGATSYFNRLGQRVIAALSVPTAAGRLYDIDVRLRPQGNQGPLVASVAAFARYGHENAWTWEHMALTRARPVFGSAPARALVQQHIDDVLKQPRDHAALIGDVGKMRDDVAAHKPPKHALDVKLIGGGLVDCEFAIHAVQLDHRTGFDPRLNVALRRLVAAGLAPAAIPAAMDLLGRMLVSLRLMAPQGPPDDAETMARVAHACGYRGAGGWEALLAAYAAARQDIGDWWAAIRSS